MLPGLWYLWHDQTPYIGMASRPIPTESKFQQLAEALGAGVFADKKSVAGQQLLEALPNKQVNLLVIYRLKERWEHEAQALRSPFFDYEAAAVRDAQKKFLNILSQHIKLEQPAYQALLQQALQDAWHLAAKPATFITSLVEPLAKPGLQLEQVEALGKYILFHGDLFRQVLKELSLTGRKEFLKGDLLRQLQQSEDRLPDTARTKYLDEYTYFLSATGIDLDEPLPVVEEAAPAEPDAVVEEGFALDNLLAALPPEPEPAPALAEPLAAVADAAVAEPEPLVMHESETEYLEIPETLVTTSLRTETEAWPEARQEVDEVLMPAMEPSTEQDLSATTEAVAANPTWPEEPPVMEPPVIHAPPVFNLANEESLADRLGKQSADQGLYARVSAAQTENLHAIIAIGDRYMMVDQLFGGDMAAYSLAVSQVNGMDGLQAALHYLWEEVAPKFNWNPESEGYKTLQTALRRKFAA